MRRLGLLNVLGLLIVSGMTVVAVGCGDDSTPCASPQIQCGGTCTDVMGTDRMNCGACGTACMMGQDCAAGVCRAAMDCTTPGQTRCGMTCFNLQTSSTNCGMCGNACPTGQMCMGGTCTGRTCDPLTLCGTDCIDTRFDPGNCGMCGNACAADQSCSNGMCICPTGQMECSGSCTDLDTDAANCGMCGNACGTDEFCVAGACIGTCVDMTNPGLMMCGTDCVDTRNDPAHCGSCGNSCPTGQVCVSGACECPSDTQMLCSGSCVDTTSDTMHCGSCTTACTTGQLCVGGGCVDRCMSPLVPCGTTCADLMTDALNCGACGSAIPVGHICVGGMAVCPAGLQDCGGMCVSIADRNHCGACATVCAEPTPICQLNAAGTSATCVNDCVTGEIRCSGRCINAAADNANCGACGNACGGGSVCNAGACACPTGQTDCDPGMAINCVNTATDRNNCGACGRACATGQACVTTGGVTACQVATPTGLRIECPSTTFPAGSGAVQCHAFLVYAGMGVPDQDVTNDTETTWTPITATNCTGSAVCPPTGGANAPAMTTTRPNAGRFTPAGSVDAAAVSTNAIATPSATWQRGGTRLTATITLTTEPAMPTGYRIFPTNPTLPYLYDVLCSPAGLTTRFVLQRTFAGGGVSYVPAEAWRVDPVGGMTPIVGASTSSDGSGYVFESLVSGGLSAPRQQSVVARVGGMDVASTTLTITNEGRDRLRVEPTAQTTARGIGTGQFRAYVDFGTLAFEITRLGDLSNVLPPVNTFGYPYYWGCDLFGAGFYPWGDGWSLNLDSSVPADTSPVTVTDFGVFTPNDAPPNTRDGTHAFSMGFPNFFIGSPSVTTFTVTVSGRQVVACRMTNVPATLSQNASTPSPGSGNPPAAGSVQVWTVQSDASVGPACMNDSTCGGNACVSGFCRTLSQQAQTAAIVWTSSAPAVATVSNASGNVGRITGVAPGTTNMSAVYNNAAPGGPVTCTTIATPTVPSTTTIPVNVVPSMLCDLIVTTRPFEAGATAPAIDPGNGATLLNRAGVSRGIGDGSIYADQAGFARRRAYYIHPNTVGIGPDASDQRRNDPVVLLPNVAGITQQYFAIGYFAADGMQANCNSTPGSPNVFALDVTAQATWDITTTAGGINNPNPTGSTLTTDAAYTVSATGLATTVASATPRRIQAIRATINSGPRFCTGNGTGSGGGSDASRNTTNPCLHALAYEVCGTPDTLPGSVVVTGWQAPDAAHHSLAPLGVTNPALEAVAPTAADADYYETFVGDVALRYYSLQRFTTPTGGCALTGAATSYQMDFSERATWTSSNPAFATVAGGAMTAVSSGTTSVTGSLTFGGSTQNDSLDFRVANGVINNIAGAPTAAVAEDIGATEGTTDPAGADLRNEVWITPAITLTAGTITPATSLGGPHPNIEWRLQAGSTDCVEQYDGTGTADTDWHRFSTVGSSATGLGGGPSAAQAAAMARFRATTSVPMGGCSVTLRPRCVSAMGNNCSPTTVTYGDVTVTVRRGSILSANFFIQAPGRTCADAPAANFTLARYQASSGTGPGMAADFFVCARTSFGARLRYDDYIGDGTENSAIGWDVPTGTPLLTDGGVGATPLADSGYARYVSSATGASAVLRATLTGLFQDSIDVFIDTDAATTLAITSPNTGASAAASCTGLTAGAPATGTFESCLLAGQDEQFQITATGPGITAPVVVTTDHAITLEQSAVAAGCGGAAAGFVGSPSDSRDRIVAANSAAMGGASGICTGVLRACVAGVTVGGVACGGATVAGFALVNVPAFTSDLAVLTGPFTSFTASPATLTLTGAGSLGTIATTTTAATMFSPVVVNTSWWPVGMADVASGGGLTSTNPFAANPLTSTYWTLAPVGLGNLAALPGTAYYGMVYSGPVPAAQTSSVVARVPNVAGTVTVAVTANP